MYFNHYIPNQTNYRNPESSPSLRDVPSPPNFPKTNHNGSPMGPPPSFTPSKPSTMGLKAIDPGSIKLCRNKFTYIWLKNGRSFWAFITFIGRKSIAGFRWSLFGWAYFGVDTKEIESFICY